MDNELNFDTGASAKSSVPLGANTIAGTVQRIIYCSNDGKFVVASLVDSKKKPSVLIGPLEYIQEGEEIEANGFWEYHKEYGPRFRVTDYRPILPSTEEGIRRYLAGGVIPGIGPKLADRIVDKFGRDTLRVLDKFSSRLGEVSGFGRNRINQVRDAWHAQTKRRDQYIFLQGLGISTSYCNRIVKKYGEDSIKVVSENPYRLATEVKGIGFKMADSIARHLNIADDHPFRLGSGIVYVLQQFADNNGHTCYPQNDLVSKAAEILGVETAVAMKGISRALADGAIVLYDKRHPGESSLAYTTQLFNVETQLSELIKVQLQTAFRKIKRIDDKTTSWSILNDAQRTAVKTAFTNSISIITGGPGVGKTTVTREIVTIATREGMDIALAAPTGRAAKRLSESSTLEAKTIHRLLKWEPEQQKFVHNEHYPLDVDLVIIDEVSMLDVILAYHLFQAIGPKTILVFIGDRDQLPSVGPGAFLADLIESKKVPVTHLTQIYRQSVNSRIITNAHKVNNGMMPDLRTSRDQLTDFYWIEQEDPEKIVDIICRMISTRIPERFHLSAVSDVQILTPMNHGICGTKNLNNRLQDVLNPTTEIKKNHLLCGDTQFRVGDRVMQTTNNYDLGVFNGDLGIIHRIDAENQCMLVLLDNAMISYALEDVDQLRLAYAITIHKSQGSEFPAVIVPIITQHMIMLRRNLIYTAMTRASKLLILIGAPKALAIAVKNYQVTPRFTELAKRIGQ